jgi:threonine-phosphate decarboxylase
MKKINMDSDESGEYCSKRSKMYKNTKKTELAFVNKLHGGYWNFELADFRYMVNPYFPPAEMLARLAGRVSTLSRSYPSTNTYISQVLSGYVGLDAENIVVSNGASELISAMSRLFIRRLAIPIPTYNEYINRLQIQNKDFELYRIQAEDGFTLNIDNYVDFARKTNSNAILFVRPNNPTGNLITLSDMESVISKLSGFDIVLVDESFIDFCVTQSNVSMMCYLKKCRNMIIIKSLGKSYGIPGLRLGYSASGNREISEALRRELPIWNINSFAQYFIELLDDYKQQFEESCVKTVATTGKLFEQLNQMQYLRPFKTECNFILCKLTRHKSTDLVKYLYDNHNILIYDCAVKTGLDDSFVRISSRTASENNRLVRALKTWQEIQS